MTWVAIFGLGLGALLGLYLTLIVIGSVYVSIASAIGSRNSTVEMVDGETLPTHAQYPEPYVPLLPQGSE